jgi:hypothetical protein
MLYNYNKKLCLIIGGIDLICLFINKTTDIKNTYQINFTKNKSSKNEYDDLLIDSEYCLSEDELETRYNPIDNLKMMQYNHNKQNLLKTIDIENNIENNSLLEEGPNDMNTLHQDMTNKILEEENRKQITEFNNKNKINKINDYDSSLMCHLPISYLDIDKKKK